MMMISFLAITPNLIAEDCCPEFSLKDAVDICPPEGACPHDDVVPPDPNHGRQMAACKLSDHVYTVYPNNPAYTYTWSVSGGVPQGTSGNPMTINWGSGSSGVIQVYISGQGCNDTITQTLCLIDGPSANFMADADTVCVNTLVNFTNLSIGGSDFLWDFGNGNFSTSFHANHSYSLPGTYNVTLKAIDTGMGQPGEVNMPCGCTDTISKTIVVLPGEGPSIDTDCCYGTVCAGDTSSFSTSAVCSTYNWSVTGGTIISGVNTNSIQVVWNTTYSGPTTVSLELPSCSSAPCPGVTTLNVPVLYPNLPINGPSTLCIGGNGTFSLPVLPGTYYTWTVTGGGYTFNQQDRNTANVNITFFHSGTYTVSCDYNNPLAGCSGSSTFTVDVKPSFTLSGIEKVCEGETETYYTPGNASWSVTPGGATVPPGNANSKSITWNTPGLYTITASAVNTNSFCNSTAVKVVEVVAKPVLGNINGPTSACPNKNLAYSISSNISGSSFNWNTNNGSIISEMGADNDSVIVQFSGSGPWQLDVYQSMVINPGDTCNSLVQTLTVNPYPVPSISGTGIVCADDTETYTVSGPVPPGGFNWSVTPSNRGTIQNGQGTNAVTILWHGPATTANLSVSSCAGSHNIPVIINAPPPAQVSYNVLPMFCLGDTQTLVLSTPSGPYTYQWFQVGNPSSIGSGSSLSINVSSFTSTGTYQYYVEVTENGCTIKSNMVNVIIKDCNGGGGGGSCDVIAWFWPYPLCDQITLIDQSIVGTGSVITNYQWTVSGPGSGTFTPNANVPNPILTVTASGSYLIELTITSASGCESVYSETVNILLPEADFTLTSPVCALEPANLSAIPNNPNFNYEWNFGDGSTSYTPVTQHAYSLASPPPYNVILTIADEMGCIATKMDTIIVNPLPECTITVTDTIFCPGDFVTLSACTSMAAYQWYRNDVAISGATSPTYDAYTHGEYMVEVTNVNGCTALSNSIDLYLHKMPVANISGNSSFCALASSNYVFTLSTGYAPDYSYNWSSNAPGVTFTPNNGTNAFMTNVSLSLPSNLPIVYNFVVEVTDTTTGCMAYDTLCVTFFEQPQVSIPFQSGCEGEPYTLIPTPVDTATYDYLWSNGSSTPVLTVSTTGFYTLTVTDKLSGCSTMQSAALIFPKPDLSLFPTGCATIACNEDLELYIPLPLNATAWPNTINDAYPVIQWLDENNTPLGTGETFTFSSDSTGSHQIFVTVGTPFGCTDTIGKYCVNVVCCQVNISSITQTNASCLETCDGSVTIELDTLSSGGPFTISQLSPSGPSWNIIPGVPLTISDLCPGQYAFEINSSTGECLEIIELGIGYDNEVCCFAQTSVEYQQISADTTLSNSTVWSGKIYVHDNVTVTVTNNAQLDVTNVDVVFGECAGIVFTNGASLRANNSVFRPCNMHKTWKGISFLTPVIADTTINVINESTFKNAEVALYFLNGSDALISNNLFSNCNYGIRVEANNQFNHPISGNRFVIEDFFPDYNISCRYSFVNNLSAYGIYANSTRFLKQVSQNEFVNGRKNYEFPRTYGILQVSGGGSFTKNSFTDFYSAIMLQSQRFYSNIQNNSVEINVETWGFPSIYVLSNNAALIEINNNQVTNNFNQFWSYAAIYVGRSSRVSIVNNSIYGYIYGILANVVSNLQISNNSILNSRSVGIYLLEDKLSTSYITCNTVSMYSLSSSIGLFGNRLTANTQVLNNCFSDTYIGMHFTGIGLQPLPFIRNNYLYNYLQAGINVQGLSGNIGTLNSPGMNTLWSNQNTAIDISSNTNITVADNFGMFNISWPQVQIVSNNPYHSTASCGNQIFNMPSQGNLNIDYTCDHLHKIIEPLTLNDAGQFDLLSNYMELIKDSDTQLRDIELIMSSYKLADNELLASLIFLADLTANEKLLLNYVQSLRLGDYENARSIINAFVPVNEDDHAFKYLSEVQLHALSSGWDNLINHVPELDRIDQMNSIHSNFSVFLLNSIDSYRDYKVDRPETDSIEINDQVKNLEDDSGFLSLHPNPASNNIFVQLINNNEDQSYIEILNASGKIVTQYNVEFVTGGIELNIKDLAQGFYFIILTNQHTGYLQRGKFIKINP